MAASGGWPAAWGAALVLAAAGLSVFHNALTNPFFFDDYPAIVENPTIRELWPPSQAFWAPRNSPFAGRPVVNASFALNYALGGLNPSGYHLVNLGLHIAGACLLFGVARRTLLREWAAAPLRENAWGLALAISLVWLIHPIQTEVINYVTQRTELLAGIFYLLTLYAAIRAWTAPRPWLAVAVASCALGMASKENMAVAPVMVVLHDLAFGAFGVGETFRRRARLYASLAATWGILLALMLTGPRTGSVGFHLGVSAWDYARTQCWIILHYLRLSFWPDRLLTDYGSQPRPSSGEVISGAIVIAGLLALTLWSWRRRRPWGFLGAWFFLNLAPTSSIVPIVTEAGAERRMYLPLAALVAGGVCALFPLIHRWLGSRSDSRFPARAAFAAGVLLLGALLGLRSYVRNEVYSSPILAWADAIDKVPTNARAYVGLSTSLLAERRFQEAAEIARRGLAVDEQEAFLWSNLGRALTGLGNHEEAVRAASRAAEFSPRSPDVLNGLVLALRMAGRGEEAARAAARATELAPDSAPAWLERANAARERGDVDNAVEYCRRAIALDPRYAEAYNYLGALHAASNPPFAVAQYQRAIQLNPELAEAHNNLANSLARMGRLDEAVHHYRTALRIQPDYPEARHNLGVVQEIRRATRSPTR